MEVINDSRLPEQPHRKGETNIAGNIYLGIILVAIGVIWLFYNTGWIGYGLFNAQERGALFIGPGVKVYEGMVVGVSPKQEDITVNVCKKKQMTNMRAAGSDEALRLVPPRKLSLEQCLEFLADDELLEVTPESLRMRKTILNHEKRMKATHGNKKVLQ